ncbi:LptF/LptG family permease, partial [Campylobacter sp.]|uniref:LptF/LptG family permease n=1 Tax=Campylobacter sp. TaxID=205 RepID=UPI002A65816D
MKVFIKYISFIYLKYFFIVFLALELFFVAIDVLNNLAMLPKSANLAVLFVVFSAASAVPFLLPLSLVFALIISLILLLRSGELVAFYALGVSKNALIKPVFIISCVITGLFVLLQCTPAAYARDVKRAILELSSQKYFSLNSAFIKNKNNFIFFGQIDEMNKTAPFAYIFEIEDAKLVKKVLASEVRFENDKWIAKTAYTQILPTDLALGKIALSYEASMNYEVLEGFEPRLLSNLNRSATSYSIIHAIATIYQTIGD